MNMINGYKIIYIPSSNNITSIHAYVETGNIYETPKNCGIAHLLEHVLGDSWNRCEGNCTEYWSKKGTLSNAQTQNTYTKYFIVGLTKEIENMIDYIASILTAPTFNAKSINRSRHAVKDELLQKMNNSEWKLYHTFYNNIVDNTQFNGFSRILNYPLKIKNLDSITRDDLINYYNNFYRSPNMFFVIVSPLAWTKVATYFTKYLRPSPGPLSETMTWRTPIKLSCRNSPEFFVHRKDAEKDTFIIGFINNNPQKKITYTIV